MLESTGALQTMPTSIFSLSEQFLKNAGIYWCAENHLLRLAIIPYCVKKEPYLFVPTTNIKGSNTYLASSLCLGNLSHKNINRSPVDTHEPTGERHHNNDALERCILGSGHFSQLRVRKEAFPMVLCSTVLICPSSVLPIGLPYPFYPNVFIFW